MLRILDTGARELRACVTFDYRGMIVSASTVFAPNNSVCVFADAKAKEPISPDFFTVEEALRWIDAHQLCGNCDARLPEGCGGEFRSDGEACKLNERRPVPTAHSLAVTLAGDARRATRPAEVRGPRMPDLRWLRKDGGRTLQQAVRVTCGTEMRIEWENVPFVEE